MSKAIQLLKERYCSAIQEHPDLYVGIELEYPVVNVKGGATDTDLTKALLVFLAEQLSFTVTDYDEDGNPVQLYDAKTGDMILFEVSYNTIEFAFGKVKRIKEVEERLNQYLALIQPYLRATGHELQGQGVNPNWAQNDNRPVKLPRYQMLMDFLKLSETKKDSFFHDYPEYGAFICGSQVQLDVSKSSYLRVLNAFNQIEGPKALLLANSEFWGSDWDLALSRDVFWEQSMHGVFEENAGVFPHTFEDEDDYFNYLAETAIFTAQRGDETFYFEPIRVREYLQMGEVRAWSSSGEQVSLVPQEDDFKTHRSYQFQDLTKRGTIEFRSVCTQPFSATFAPAAFHLGLLLNLDKLEEILQETAFFERYQHDYPKIRRLFSKKVIPEADLKAALPLTKALVNCAREGLVHRGYGEESYLKPLVQRLAELGQQ